jgi:hypothetical protein
MLCKLVNSYGILNMAIWYFVPYLWLNHWIGEPSLLSPLINLIIVQSS